MTPETIALIQVGTVLAYIGTLFGLYRLFVRQKDATIETLRQQLEFLRDRLQEAERNSGDALTESLHRRIEILTTELARLMDDQGARPEAIRLVEQELERTESAIEQLRRAQKAFGFDEGDLFCPDCNSPLKEREFGYVEMNGGEREFEIWEYECGRTAVDGDVQRPCSFNPPPMNPQSGQSE